jgi:hypothetical protein
MPQIACALRPSGAAESVRVLSIEMDVDLTSWMSVRGTHMRRGADARAADGDRLDHHRKRMRDRRP